MSTTFKRMASVRLALLLLSALLVGTTGCVALMRTGERLLEWRLEGYGLAHRVVQVDEARVEYWEGGTGAPVVLLHGFGPTAPWAWSKQIAALDQGFRLLAPNLLWFGKSVDAKREFGIDRQVEVVAGLMEWLGFRDAAVIGASYGGLVAYRLAVVRPELVGRLVLIDSPGPTFQRDDYEALLARHGVDDGVELFVPAAGAGIERLVASGYWDAPSIPDPLDAAAVEVMYEPHRAEKVALLRTLISSIESWAGHPAPRQPSLLIWGRDDTVFPLATGRRLARDLDAELIVIPEARHAPHLEHADLVNRLLLDWLRAGERT